jgi:hypothetical protein
MKWAADEDSLVLEDDEEICPECDGKGGTYSYSYDEDGEPTNVDDPDFDPCNVCGGKGFITH